MAVHGTLLPPPPLLKLTEQGAVALFLDFDGTLVAIAETPDAIRVADTLGKRLESLAERMAGRLALVSGRSLEDLATHLGKPAIFRAGSHGAALIDPSHDMIGQPPEKLPAKVTDALSEFADSQELHFEAKSHGAALHYRARPEMQATAEEFAAGLARAHDLEIKTGKLVVELVRPGGGKACAVHILMQQSLFAASVPVFIGDDVTDEDGFAAANTLGGFGIAVGERKSAAARYHLQTIEDVHQWLKL